MTEIQATVDAILKDAQHHGIKGQKWGVRKSDTLGVSNLRSHGSTVITVPSKADGPAVTRKSGDRVALATHNIAKQLTTGPHTEKLWSDIHSEMVKATGPMSGKLTAKNLPVINEIVARHLTASANQFTKAGTTARVMVTHTLNKKLNPNEEPSLHLIVGKKKSDVDGYVAEAKQALNGDHAGTDPNKDWIVHADLGSELDVLELQPIIDANGFITGIKDPDLVHSDVVDDILAHHGIKGQKWGIRRKADSSTGLVSKGDVRIKQKTDGSPKVKGGTFSERRAVRTALKKGIVQPDEAALRGPHGLVPRHSSADQIAQDRIASKLDTLGPHALSNKEIQDFTRRIQVQAELSRVLASTSKADQAKADGFIKSFVKKQGARSFDRVATKAIDVALETALSKSGHKIGEKKPELGGHIVEVATRLAPKKKGK